MVYKSFITCKENLKEPHFSGAGIKNKQGKNILFFPCGYCILQIIFCPNSQFLHIYIGIHNNKTHLHVFFNGCFQC